MLTGQAKDTSLAFGFYRRQRTDEAFDLFYEGIAEASIIVDLTVGAPQLPRYRRAPARIDDGAPGLTALLAL